MTKATTRGRKNLKPRNPRAPLTWIQEVDDDHSFALRKRCKYRQFTAIRDKQIYADATLIEFDADHALIYSTPARMTGAGPQAVRRWKCDVDGNCHIIREV